MRNVLLGAALVSLAAGWLAWPLYGVGALFLAAAWWAGRPSRALRGASVKYGVRGRVDEVLTYKAQMPDSTSWTPLYAYRLGGELYNLSHGGGPAHPGERVAFEYLDRGKGGLEPLFFHREGGAPSAFADRLVTDNSKA